MSVQACEPAKGCWILSECEEQIDGKYLCDYDPILEATPYTVFVFLLIPIFIGIGILGGLGAGMIKRPIFNLMLNYPSNVANQVTDILVFSGGLFNALVLFFEKHPDHVDMPIINFDLAVIFNLAMPLAWSAGSSLSDYLPKLATYAIQEIFLIIVIPILWKNTLTQKKLEQDNRLSRTMVIESIQPPQEVVSSISLTEAQLALYSQFYKRDRQKLQCFNLSLIFLSFGLNQLLFFMRANKVHPSILGFDLCSKENDSVIGLILLINIIFTGFVYYIKRKEELIKHHVHYRESRQYYTPFNTFALYFFCGFLSGLMAGLIGIGAGIIMVTSMLYKGIIAREAAATSAFNYFMLSLNVLVAFNVQNTLTVKEESFFFIIGALSILLLTKPSYMLMNKYKVGYVVLIVDIIQVTLNIFSIILLCMLDVYLFGVESLTKVNKAC